MIVKVPVLAVAAIVIEAGTVAALVLLEVSDTEAPPVGAGEASVTVPVEDVPPMTEVGLSETVRLLVAVTVRAADFDAPFSVPVMLPFASWVTTVVVIVKVPVVAPAEIVVVAGTVAALFVDAKAMDRPPVGAALLIVSVPVDEAGPITDVGFSVSDDSVGAVIVKLALAVLAPVPAVMAAVVLVATATVATLKVALVALAATVTVVGTVAEALPEPSGTDIPLVGAGPESDTVPVEATPPTTEVGLSVTVLTTGASTVRLVVCFTPNSVAVMVTLALELTGIVVAVKVALVAP